LTATLLASACGRDKPTDPAATASSTTTSTTPVPSTTSSTAAPATPAPAPAPAPTPAPSRPADLGAVRLQLTQIATLDKPVAMAVRPGYQHLYVAEKTGRIQVLDGQPGAIVDLSSEVSSGSEQGLLGLAFSPDGKFLYADYTDRAGDTRLVEWTMGDGLRAVDPASRREVLFVDQPASNHNGGTLAFGPDGYLWFGLGDGGGSGNQYGNAQNTNTLLGDLLRIDPRPAGADPYSSPPDNPFASQGGRQELAVIGVRNPWKFSFDRATGDLWIGDVGQNAYEEIDYLPAGGILGANLGWPYLEGTHTYSGTAPAGLTAPIYDYGRGSGQSVVGGYVYRGASIPALVGGYVFADTYASDIRLLNPAPSGLDVRSSGVTVPGGTIVSFGEDTAGELYVMSLNGGVFRLDPA
jgi:glucose/arabinose dehydrogenase